MSESGTDLVTYDVRDGVAWARISNGKANALSFDVLGGLDRCLTLADPRAIALGSEPVRVGADAVGRVTSGGYGYTVEKSIAYAYLPSEHGVGTEVAVEIFGEWVPGVVAKEPLFDPEGERIRA